MSVYKVPKIYQEPLDNILYDWSDSLVPILKAYGVTPNMITAFGFSCGLLGAYLFYHDHYVESVIMLAISVFLDSCDGHMARKYNMGTEFGKYFDQISDIIRVGTLYYIMFIKDPDKFYRLFTVSIIFFIFSLSHLTCQQIELNEPHYVYDKIKFLCLGKKSMLTTRFFGSVLFNCLLMWCIYTWDM